MELKSKFSLGEFVYVANEKRKRILYRQIMGISALIMHHGVIRIEYAIEDHENDNENLREVESRVFVSPLNALRCLLKEDIDWSLEDGKVGQDFTTKYHIGQDVFVIVGKTINDVDSFSIAPRRISYIEGHEQQTISKFIEYSFEGICESDDEKERIFECIYDHHSSHEQLVFDSFEEAVENLSSAHRTQKHPYQ